jgi:putative SOS response-associated peptidase YedK
MGKDAARATALSDRDGRWLPDRMPVILGREKWSAWLGEVDAIAEELLRMLRPFPSHLMQVYPVDRRVGNVQGWAVADSRVCWRKNRWEMDRM